MRVQEDVAPDVFRKPTTLVRKFVEDYHENLEEKFIFPQFEKAKKLGDLVKLSREQPEAGWKVTDVILINSGFWTMAPEARADWSMLLGSIFLLGVGAGS